MNFFHSPKKQGADSHPKKKKVVELQGVTVNDELRIQKISETIVKKAVFNVNPQADAETKTGLEPRYYLKLEIKAALRDFEKKHRLHLSDSNEENPQTNTQGHSLQDYIINSLIALVEPHFEGGEGPHKLHSPTYIRYIGGPEVSAQIPTEIERALAGYRKNTPLDQVKDIQVEAAPQQGIKR